MVRMRYKKKENDKAVEIDNIEAVTVEKYGVCVHTPDSKYKIVLNDTESREIIKVSIERCIEQERDINIFPLLYKSYLKTDLDMSKVELIKHD